MNSPSAYANPDALETRRIGAARSSRVHGVDAERPTPPATSIAPASCADDDEQGQTIGAIASATIVQRGTSDSARGYGNRLSVIPSLRAPRHITPLLPGQRDPPRIVVTVRARRCRDPNTQVRAAGGRCEGDDVIACGQDR